MTETPRQKADALLEATLKATGARDPREFYREQLKELRAESPTGYEKAVEHYTSQLIPTILDGVNPLAAWTEYGRTLAVLRAPGRTVCIDASGRASDWAFPPASGMLILHMPDEKRRKALVVGLPAELSDAQKATWQWLVAGKLRLKDAD